VVGVTSSNSWLPSGLPVTTTCGNWTTDRAGAADDWALALPMHSTPAPKAGTNFHGLMRIFRQG
jgi:hypothetical protein